MQSSLAELTDKERTTFLNSLYENAINDHERIYNLMEQVVKNSNESDSLKKERIRELHKNKISSLETIKSVIDTLNTKYSNP